EELAETPVQWGERDPVSAAVTLRSGRSYGLESGVDADRLGVRSRPGDVLLKGEGTDSGPVLSFRAASGPLQATHPLELWAGSVAVRAASEVRVEAGGDLVQRAGRHHHLDAGADVRVEGANVELLAAEGRAEILARGAVSVDGEHVGLNDKALPAP